MARCINSFRIVLGWTHKWMLIKLINHTLYGGLFPKNDLSLSFYARIVMTYAIYSIHVLKQHLSWSVSRSAFFSKGKHRCLNYSMILLVYSFGFLIDFLWKPVCYLLIIKVFCEIIKYLSVPYSLPNWFIIMALSHFPSDYDWHWQPLKWNIIKYSKL